MANTPDYSWPPIASRKVIGKSFKRLDGPAKSSGRAKYSSDFNAKGMLFGAYLVSPYAHCKVTSIDTSPAEKMAGVKSVHVAAPAGTEVNWEGFEIAGVAATTEEAAREAVRAIKIEYEVHAVGMSICLFCLTVAFVAVAIASGYFCARALDVSQAGPAEFVVTVLGLIDLNVYLQVVLKTVLIGLLAGVICCRQGLNTAAPGQLTDAVSCGFGKSLLAAFLISGATTMFL